MVRYIRGKQTYGACCIGNSGILVVFIDLIHALFQKGRSLLVVCITQSFLEPTDQTVGSTSSASRHFHGKTTKYTRSPGCAEQAILVQH